MKMRDLMNLVENSDAVLAAKQKVADLEAALEDARHYYREAPTEEEADACQEECDKIYDRLQDAMVELARLKGEHG